MWKSFGTVRSSKRRAPDVQKVVNVIHWINLYLVDKPVDSLKLIHWRIIYPGLYPVDAAIELLNNWDQGPVA